MDQTMAINDLVIQIASICGAKGIQNTGLTCKNYYRLLRRNYIFLRLLVKDFGIFKLYKSIRDGLLLDTEKLDSITKDPYFYNKLYAKSVKPTIEVSYKSWHLLNNGILMHFVYKGLPSIRIFEKICVKNVQIYDNEIYIFVADIANSDIHHVYHMNCLFPEYRKYPDRNDAHDDLDHLGNLDNLDDFVNYRQYLERSDIIDNLDDFVKYGHNLYVENILKLGLANPRTKYTIKELDELTKPKFIGTVAVVGTIFNKIHVKQTRCYKGIIFQVVLLEPYKNENFKLISVNTKKQPQTPNHTVGIHLGTQNVVFTIEEPGCDDLFGTKLVCIDYKNLFVRKNYLLHSVMTDLTTDEAPIDNLWTLNLPDVPVHALPYGMCVNHTNDVSRMKLYDHTVLDLDNESYAKQIDFINEKVNFEDIDLTKEEYIELIKNSNLKEEKIIEKDGSITYRKPNSRSLPKNLVPLSENHVPIIEEIWRDKGVNEEPVNKIVIPKAAKIIRIKTGLNPFSSHRKK